MFQGVHSTVIGDSHIRKGIVCQDSSGTVVTDKFAIAVVADGHGSAKHFRSDVGSRIAVKITKTFTFKVGKKPKQTTTEKKAPTQPTTEKKTAE